MGLFNPSTSIALVSDCERRQLALASSPVRIRVCLVHAWQHTTTVEVLTSRKLPMSWVAQSTRNTNQLASEKKLSSPDGQYVQIQHMNVDTCMWIQYAPFNDFLKQPPCRAPSRKAWEHGGCFKKGLLSWLPSSSKNGQNCVCSARKSLENNKSNHITRLSIIPGER